MSRFRLIVILVLLLTSLATRGADKAESDSYEIENLSDSSQIEYDSQSGLAMARNGVRITSKGNVITANQATINDQTGDIIATGGVTFVQGHYIWTSESIEYNFKTGHVKAENFKAGSEPFYVGGNNLNYDAKEKIYSANDVFVTTDDVPQPGFKIKAKRIKVVPGEYVEAYQAVLYNGNIPIMYFPKYKRQLDKQSAFTFTPGYRSVYGPYLRSAYNWSASTNLNGVVHLDYRAFRGVGAGPDFSWNLGGLGSGSLKTYYLHDEDPDKIDSGRHIDSDRYRVRFEHSATLRTNLSLKIAANKQSDPFVTRDFFEGEYKRNMQPPSFVEVNQLWPNYSLNILANLQLNDFFETVERLPDVKLSAYRQKIGSSPLYYESESSVGYFKYKFADDAFQDYSAFRADTYHQITLPKTFFGWLNITPRVGGRLTYYGKSDDGATVTEETSRWVFNTGAEISTKASRTWPGVKNKLLKIDGLRHIIEPSINYAYVPNPSKRAPDLPQFDKELPSLKLLPIQYPDYNSIDSIDGQNVIRLGLRNKLQTKREAQIANLLNWALYSDWNLHPKSNQKTFKDLYSDLDFQPRSWIILSSETRYDINESHWNEANHYLTLQPNDVWSWAIGHRYLREMPYQGINFGNNLITSRFYFKLNENYAFRISHQFEARDGTLEEQYYTIYRDLRSWTAALTFRVRDYRTRPTDLTIAITFSMKAFPRFGLGSDREQPELLLDS
jgi:lipopolysaccharide assembly outer membrane protein LptD (OstA)